MRWAAARLALASAAKRRAACFKSAPLAQVSSRLWQVSAKASVWAWRNRA